MYLHVCVRTAAWQRQHRNGPRAHARAVLDCARTTHAPHAPHAPAHSTAEERNGNSKRYFLHMPVAVDTPSGPRLNSKFKAQFKDKFPNTMSRVILVCAAAVFRVCLRVLPCVRTRAT